MNWIEELGDDELRARLEQRLHMRVGGVVPFVIDDLVDNREDPERARVLTELLDG